MHAVKISSRCGGTGTHSLNQAVQFDRGIERGRETNCGGDREVMMSACTKQDPETTKQKSANMSCAIDTCFFSFMKNLHKNVE